MSKKLLKLLALLMLMASGAILHAKTKKSYAKKAPFAGFGKKSKANGQFKTKPVSCHGKRTKKGYTFVNSYSRSR